MTKLLQNILLFTDISIYYNLSFRTLTCAILLILSTGQTSAFVIQNDSVNTIDLSTNVYNNDTEIELNSDWEFYWKQLIEPGQFSDQKSFSKVSLNNWTTFYGNESNFLPSFGYATYRLRVSLPDKRPHMSLYIPAAYSASKLWLNGKLISETGKVSTSKDQVVHRRSTQIIPLSTSETHFDIVIQVANFYHHKGGIDKPIKLGATKRLNTVKTKHTIADMLFIGCLGFIGLFFLLFYMFYWNKDKSALYFAILSISMAYMALSDRYAPLSYISDTISWTLLTKIEYISLFLAGTSAGLFINSIFFEFTHKAYEKFLRYGFITLAILAILLPRSYFTQLVLPFLILMIFNLTYVFIIITKAIIKGRRQESILLLISTIIGFIVFSMHLFFFLGESANSIIYVNFGYVVAFLLLSMLLMTRFSKSFKELETTKEIALKQKNEISVQSKALANVNTELKENLKQLENFNSELDGFNRIVSHDLKAPLVAMHSLVSFIEEDTKTKVNKEIEHHFELLKDRITKMDALINGLLEYSKVAKGDKVKEQFSFNDLLTEVFDTVNISNENSLILPKTDIEVFANQIELKHVFHNLISNAIKHNDKDKVIINVSVSNRENKYEFSIKDNGPGIDKKYHSKIFEMFSQLSVDEKSKSTGIGLTIVKRIVLENQGEIFVDSEKGLSTTITFTWKI